jgi:tight adherence protein C
MDQTMIIILIASFSALALFTYGLCVYFNRHREIQDRFAKQKTELAPLVSRRLKTSIPKKKIIEFFSSLGKMSLRKTEQKKIEGSRLRLTLIQAGFRYSNAVAAFYGIKAICTIIIPLGYMTYVIWANKVTMLNLSIALGAAALGYHLPNYILSRVLKKRQDRIDRALPDVLDLMIVCMEAGLSLQSTLNHVAEEVRRVSKDLHQELRITNAELRTGIPRDKALRNLGERTGVQSVNSLISLMIQTEKMGASIAQSLRTHADFVRVRRGQRAEEMATKLPVKLVFPTFFCIFPALFIVILGPAAFQIYRNIIHK